MNMPMGRKRFVLKMACTAVHSGKFLFATGAEDTYFQVWVINLSLPETAPSGNAEPHCCHNRVNSTPGSPNGHPY